MVDRARSLAVCALAGLLQSCTASALTYREAILELDSVERVEGSGRERRIVYLEEAVQMPWHSRAVLLWPLKPVLNLFWGEPSKGPVTQPAYHARQLVSVLGGKAGGSLLRCAEVAIRIVPIIESDGSALNRVTALTTLAEIAANQDFDTSAGLMDRATWPATQPEERNWIATLNQHVPHKRGTAPFEPEQQGQYRQALIGLTTRPLLNQDQRWALVSELASALRAEREWELREPTEEALHAALRHLVQWTVIAAMLERGERLAEVRLLAMQILHRAGGTDVVPLILALVASPEDFRATGRRFDKDEDEYVRLHFVHLCGQLDEARARRRLRLPGREEWEAVSAVDYLADLVLNSETWSGIRIVAQEALCRCLSRPIDLDTGWVAAWYRDYQRGT